MSHAIVRGGAVGQPQARAYARQQLLEPERLGEVVDRPAGERLQARVELGLRGQHDHRGRDSAAPQLQHLEAAELGQHQVEHDQVERARQAELRAAPLVVRELDREARRPQPADQTGGDRRVVLDDQDFGGVFTRGHGLLRRP